jgi:hypothetical protein
MNYKFFINIFIAFTMFFYVVADIAADKSEDSSLYSEIPKKYLISLKKQIADAQDIASSTSQRRAYKKIIRNAEKTVEKYSSLSGRFEFISIIFECQKVYLSLQPNLENQKALLRVASKLQAAPDQYAKYRVEADVLFLQMELSSNDNPEQSALAIAKLADRYRNTPGEAHSLMLASTLVFDLGNRLLLKAFQDTLSKQFGHDPQVVAFMRERFATNNSVNFNGIFKTVDNQSLSFPIGQPYLLCFWSNETPLLDEKIKAINTFQKKYEKTLKVYSFNLDELPDSGKNALRRMKLDWVPIVLPGGVNNALFQSMGASNLYSALLVNSHGLANTKKMGSSMPSLQRDYESNLKYSDFNELLCSLSNGDFLISGTPEVSDTSELPIESLKSIQACFITIPDRYKLSKQKAFENYKKAEELCRDLIAKHKKSIDLWVVYNRHIVSLLGMWRSTGNFDYLNRALKSAKATLAMDIPKNARVVSYLCIATEALFRKEKGASLILKDFIINCGGEQANGLAYSTAMLLAFQAHLKEEYSEYKNTLIEKYMNDPSIYAITSLLYDTIGTKHLFEPAFPSKKSNSNVVFKIEKAFKFKGKDSYNKTVVLPVNKTKTNITVFYEGQGDRKTQSTQNDLLSHLNKIVNRRPLKDIEITCVFTNISKDQIEALMKKNKSSFNTILLQKNEWDLLVKEFGVFSFNHRANIYITNPSGKIVHAITGISQGITSLTSRLDQNIREYDLSLASIALNNKDFKTYAARLETSFPLKNRRLSRHESRTIEPNKHRRKLVWAYMQTNQWELALKHINVNLEKAHHKKKLDPRYKSCKLCFGHLDGALVRAVMLKKLGRIKEAEELEALVKLENCPLDNDEKNIFADIHKIIDGRTSNRRFTYLKDPARYLAYQENNMRQNNQALFAYKKGSDYLTRSIIYKNLGNIVESEKDKKRAESRAWPYKVKIYDLYDTYSVCIKRRELANENLQTNKHNEALKLIQENIRIHENEALRTNSTCKVCDNQSKSFKHKSNAHEYLKDEKAAKESLDFSKTLKCPPDNIKRESFHAFPINRLNSCGPGKGRLLFIDSHMRGKTYANALYRKYRFDLAHDLLIRAKSYKALGENEKAEFDIKRATALTYPYGPKSTIDIDILPDLYIDVLNVSATE